MSNEDRSTCPEASRLALAKGLAVALLLLYVGPVSAQTIWTKCQSRDGTRQYPVVDPFAHSVGMHAGMTDNLAYALGITKEELKSLECHQVVSPTDLRVMTLELLRQQQAQERASAAQAASNLNQQCQGGTLTKFANHCSQLNADDRGFLSGVMSIGIEECGYLEGNKALVLQALVLNAGTPIGQRYARAMTCGPALKELTEEIVRRNAAQ